MSEREPVALTVPVKGGELTVTVVAATDQDGYAQDPGEEYSTRKYWAEAAVLVEGEVKVRGIEYTVSGVTYRWLRVARQVYVDHKETEATTHWQWDYNNTRYDGGYRRKDSGKKADRGSATDKYIDGLVTEALEAFDAGRPGWRTESFRLRLERKIAHEEGQAASRRREALEHDEKANRLRLELEKLDGTDP